MDWVEKGAGRIGEGRHAGSEGGAKIAPKTRGCKGFEYMEGKRRVPSTRGTVYFREEEVRQTRTFAFAGFYRYRRGYYTKGTNGVCIVVWKCEGSRG